MKNVLSFAILSMISFAAFADPNPAFLVSSSPTISTVIGVGTCIGGGHSPQERQLGCAISATTAVLSTLVLLKEEVHQVEADGYSFLAGESMTLALEEVIQELRNGAPELNEASDQEVVFLMLDSIKG